MIKNQRDTAVNLVARGDERLRRGELFEAHLLFSQARIANEATLKTHGRNQEDLSRQYETLQRLTSCDRLLGSSERAINDLEDQLAIAHELLAIADESVPWRWHSALRHVWMAAKGLADVERECNRFDRAHAHYQVALATAGKMTVALAGHEEVPNVLGVVPQNLRDLSATYHGLSLLEAARDQHFQSSAYAEAAVLSATQCLAIERTLPHSPRSPIVSLVRLGSLLRESGRIEEAAQRFREAVALVRQYGPKLTARGQHLLVQRDLAQVLTEAARSEAQLDRLGEARSALEERLAIARALGAAGEEALVPADGLVRALAELGDVVSKVGDIGSASTLLAEEVVALAGLRSHIASIPELCLGAARRTVLMHQSDSQVSESIPFAQLAAIWRRMSEHLDLAESEVIDRARPHVARFHALWLLLVLQRAPERVPEVLAAMQGRKLAAMVLEELEQQTVAEGTDAELRQRFLALRRELRRLTLGLQVLEGDAGRTDADGQRGPGLEQGVSASAEIICARQAEYDTVLAEYRQVLLELSERPGYEAIAPQQIELGQLQPSLAPDDALVLLVQTPGEEQAAATVGADLAAVYALVLRSGGHALVPVPELAHSPRRMQFTAAEHSRMAGMRYVAGAAGAAEQLVDEVTDAADTPLADYLDRALWVPLREHLQGVRVLHAVTHGDLHVLPLQALAPEGLELRQYPGLVFYWLQHLAPQRAVDTPEPAVAVQVHSPERGSQPPPIPFVHAEAGVLGSMWSQVHTPLPLAEPRVLAVVHLAGHGDAGSGADASLLIGPQEHLGLHRVLGGQLRAPIVYLSACLVGRITEDLDGDPLGLVSAFMLKGVRSVVAPLVPVPDRYSPVAAALWHWAIVRQIQAGEPPDAHRALGWAKARLRDGRWPDQVLQLLLQHYAQTIAREIERLCHRVTEHGGQADVFSELRRQFESWLDGQGHRDLPLMLCDEIDSASPQGLSKVIGKAARTLAEQMLGQREHFASRPELRALLDFVQVYGTADARSTEYRQLWERRAAAPGQKAFLP